MGLPAAERAAGGRGPNNTIAHAQLTLKSGMIMLGSAGDTPFDALQKPPRAVGGVGTQSASIVVEDVDSHHARADPTLAAIQKSICGASVPTIPGLRSKNEGRAPGSVRRCGRDHPDRDGAYLERAVREAMHE